MASSVSSERAFSSAGITISKRRNRLKADIVESLQGLKCLIRHDILFREHPTASLELSGDLDELDASEQGGSTAQNESSQGSAGDPDENSWDQLVIDDSDFSVFDTGIDDDDIFVQNLE